MIGKIDFLYTEDGTEWDFSNENLSDIKMYTASLPDTGKYSTNAGYCVHENGIFEIEPNNGQGKSGENLIVCILFRLKHVD